jgi:hypothetical protein
MSIQGVLSLYTYIFLGFIMLNNTAIKQWWKSWSFRLSHFILSFAADATLTSDLPSTDFKFFAFKIDNNSTN